jgi:hypothetical protein
MATTLSGRTRIAGGPFNSQAVDSSAGFVALIVSTTTDELLQRQIQQQQ